MDELMSAIIPSIRTFLHRDQILLDAMPLVMHIVIPNIRSVSTVLIRIWVITFKLMLPVIKDSLFWLLV